MRWQRHVRLEGLTKLVVVGSLAASVAVKVTLVGQSHGELSLLAGLSFGAAFVLGVFWSDTIASVLVWAFVAPALAVLVGADDSVAAHTLWVAGMLGAVLPRSTLRRWMLPAPWRVPLVGWALGAAVTWPIIAARELDFNTDLLRRLPSPVSAIGLPASAAIFGTADTAGTLLLGIVWVDFLFATFADKAPEFRRQVIGPLMASAVAACAFAAYQRLGDMAFLNQAFGKFGRAGGTMLDANAFGVVAVFCSCGLVALMDARRLAWTFLLSAGLALACVGLWASGSRTALVAELIAIACLLPVPFRRTVFAAAVPRRPLLAAATILASVAAFGLVLYALRATGPLLRLGWILPSASVESVRAFAVEMWDRFGYGRAAVQMIRAHPWVGVGIGSFPVIVGDFPYSHVGGPLFPDNAQNWVRHQLAELGIVGSVGWVAWTAVLAATAFRHRNSATASFRTAIVGGAIAGVVVVSQLGMPTTNVAVAIAFWTFAFWYGSLKYTPETWAGRSSAVRPGSWLIMTAILLAFAGGTLYAALTSLRVPMRARNAGWEYIDGFYSPQPAASGGEFRWTQQHAVAVVPAPKRVVKLTIWVTRGDIGARPLHARVWHEQRLVIDTVIRDLVPLTRYVVIDSPPPWLMVRTADDRVIALDSSGAVDDRAFELAVEWTFLDALPADERRASEP